MSNTAGVPTLPPNTLVPIELGTGYVGKLYELMAYLVADKTPEELTQLDEAIKNNTFEQEPWMKHYMTVIVLLKHIEEVAIEKNLVTYEDLNAQDN